MKTTLQKLLAPLVVSAVAAIVAYFADKKIITGDQVAPLTAELQQTLDLLAGTVCGLVALIITWVIKGISGGGNGGTLPLVTTMAALGCLLALPSCGTTATISYRDPSGAKAALTFEDGNAFRGRRVTPDATK